MKNKEPLVAKELREKLAVIEHERWADWQRWMHSRLTEHEKSYAVSKSDYEHWERQINTPYADLSKQEQLSDLQQVDRYWSLIETYAADRELQGQNKVLNTPASSLVSVNMGKVSDGWHTFDELYHYRMLYNAAFLNELHAHHKELDIHKSWRHSDGELCFGKDDYFVVVAQLPVGQVTNHYHGEFWDLFQIPEKDRAAEYDGHTPAQAAARMEDFIRGKNY